jgi:hypothetical protein
MKNKWLYIAGAGVSAIGVTIFMLVALDKRAKRKLAAKQAAEEPPYEAPKEKPTTTKASIGRKIYTKGSNTQLRSSARVNNGIINNVSATVNLPNTYIGVVSGIEIPNKEYINPATMQPYVWIYFAYAAQPSKKLYVREDVVTLK